jgi:uncharacterized protein DUF3307
MGALIGLLIALQVKHFFADFVLQTSWMIGGKANPRHAGGYVHAAIHGGATTLVLLGFAVAWPWAIGLGVAELCVHYLIDLIKARAPANKPSGPGARRFWAMHGADQLGHHLTYALLLALVVRFSLLPA